MSCSLYVPTLYLLFNQLNINFQQAYDVAGDPQVPAEARQNLLRDARSVRDIYMQDRTRKENQLLAAQQTIVTLTAELRIADEKLITIEDIVGEVRARMNKRGLATHPITRRPLSIVPTPASTVTSPQQPRMPPFFITPFVFLADT